nr:FIST C-terminal domain-containing protein [Lachnospiraceae bacterium]
MKQFQFAVKNITEFKTELVKIRQWCRSRVVSDVLFQIYMETPDNTKVDSVCRLIDEKMPDALYVGCTSNGNIVNGDFSGGTIAVSCYIFEYVSTKVEVLQYKLTEDTQESVARDLKKYVEDRPEVKAIEMLLTIRGMSMTGLCDNLSKIREDINIFGGGAFSFDINADRACVFSKTGGYDEKGIVFVLLGGDEFHVETTYITGWKPLGKKLEVTSSDGFILKEINHKPAYETYYRYLHIQNDEHFFNNTLEFPFLYKHNGIDILRAPISSNPDGSLTMTADVEENVAARIAYGDPWTILESIHGKATELSQFAPDALIVFSCAARRTYWGNDEVGKETLMLQSVAPTAGFYTSGEFLRTGKYLNQHNVTLAIAALREGDIHEIGQQPEQAVSDYTGKVSMINRLATFISATTEELIQANERLELMAITDGLTGLYNRKEIQRRIIESVENKEKT